MSNFTSHGYIDYVHLYEYELGPYLSIIFFAFILILLFLSLSTIAETLFCPNLSSVTCIFQIPESVAGVTVTAFANGVADIFSTFSSFNSDAAPLALGELVGSSLFVSMCTVGLISIFYPTKLPRWIIARDLTFLLVALILFAAVIFDGYIYFWESVLLLAYYLAYVSIVIFYSLYQQKPVTQSNLIGIEETIPVNRAKVRNIGVEQLFDDPDFDVDYFQPELHYKKSQIVDIHGSYRRSNAYQHDTTQEDILNYQTMDLDPPNLFDLEYHETLLHLFPIVFEWDELDSVKMYYEILKTPLILVFNLTVPVIHERHLEPRDEYTQISLSTDITLETLQEEICAYPRFLLTTQLFLAPISVSICLRVVGSTFIGVPIWFWSLCLGGVLSYTGFHLTKRDPVIKYAKLLTFFGFIQSVFYIIALSGELVSLIEALGHIYQLKSSVLGLTLFAVGNSLGGKF
jgi:Ca2+/Na+ antiporter